MSNEGVENPENEAEDPAPMAKADQGKADSSPKPHNPKGQQGSTQPWQGSLAMTPLPFTKAPDEPPSRWT
jgi:hypothetical protein